MHEKLPTDALELLHTFARKKKDSHFPVQNISNGLALDKEDTNVILNNLVLPCESCDHEFPFWSSCLTRIFVSLPPKRTKIKKHENNKFLPQNELFIQPFTHLILYCFVFSMNCPFLSSLLWKKSAKLKLILEWRVKNFVLIDWSNVSRQTPTCTSNISIACYAATKQM